MYNKVKITKRQIKEDKFTTLMLTTKNRLAENWQFAAIGAVAVILVITAAAYYVSSARKSQTEAADRFARAMLDAQSGNSDVAKLSLNSIIEDYGNSDVAEQATMYLAKLNFTDRNYSEADRYFQMYLDKYHSDKLNRAAALAGIGAGNENQGQFAEAAAKFSAAADEDPGGPLEGDYLLGAVRNYLAANQPDMAREKQKLITEKYQGSQFDEEAKRLIYEKGAEQPES